MDTQAAFDCVADIVSQRAASFIIEGNAAPSAEDCLFYLAEVCQAWGYSGDRIYAHAEMIKEQNDFLSSFESGVFDA